MEATAAIQLETVSKRYGDQAALSDVTLAAAQGERLALLGHNGAGKTTLIKLLLGLTRPSEAGSRCWVCSRRTAPSWRCGVRSATCRRASPSTTP